MTFFTFLSFLGLYYGGLKQQQAYLNCMGKITQRG